MTNTLKVQGFLAVFGAWDATLAFVLAGAILPMAVAWRLAARRKAAVLGFARPAPPGRKIDMGLVAGSLLFGIGWAVAGLCPGPPVASLGYGGGGGLVFLLAMAAGMLIAIPLRSRTQTAGTSAQRTKMNFQALTPDYAVSPQIDQSDLAAIKAAGFTTVIDNRPDGEIPRPLHGDAMKTAAEALGLTFVINPVLPGDFSDHVLATQRAAMQTAQGPVFAYCATGNRCSCVWALVHAGQQSTDDLIAAPARFGFNLEPLRPRIDAAAR